MRHLWRREILTYRLSVWALDVLIPVGLALLALGLLIVGESYLPPVPSPH